MVSRTLSPGAGGGPAPREVGREEGWSIRFNRAAAFLKLPAGCRTLDDSLGAAKQLLLATEKRSVKFYLMLMIFFFYHAIRTVA